MDGRQKSALKKCLSDLSESLDVDGVLLELAIFSAITWDYRSEFERIANRKERCVKLLTDLSNKTPPNGTAWELLIKALIKVQQRHLAESLIDSLELATGGQFEQEPSHKMDFISTLKKKIQEEALEPLKYWSDFLPIDEKFSKIFHPFKIIRTHATRLIDQENHKIENYDYLSHTDFRICFVEGDPGIGKTTYVSKLAHDWATGREDICKLFDTVFLLRCTNVDQNVDLPDQICQSMNISKQYANIILDTLKSERTLIIFDGYDENPLKVVNELMKKPLVVLGGKEHHVFAKMLVTGRGIHAPMKEKKEGNENNLDRLDRCDYWLKILGFSDDDIDAYLTKHNPTEEEKNAIHAIHESDFCMKEMLRNPLLAMICASLGPDVKLSELQSQQRLYTIFQSFMTLYKDISKQKQYYAEKTYEVSFNAVCKYAAYRFSPDDFIKSIKGLFRFVNYRPDYEMLTKFGLVRCVKSKLSSPDVNISYGFFHQMFLEYFAAKWFSTHYVDSMGRSSDPFHYFLSSNSQEIFLRENKISYCRSCAFSVEKIHQTLSEPQEIRLWKWTFDPTNLPQFFKHFKEIAFVDCKFAAFENDRSRWNSVSTERVEIIEKIEILGICHYPDVINLFAALTALKPTKLKFLNFNLFIPFYDDLNDSTVTAINAAAADFAVEELRIDFTSLDEKEELIFFLTIVEKLLGKIQRCTFTGFPFPITSPIFDSLVPDIQTKLEAIADKLEQNFRFNPDDL